VQFVKEWSAKNNETYMCAATKPEVREAYRAKYGVSKRKPQYKEEQDMGAEDVDAKDVSRVVKRKTVKKTVAQSKEVLSEDEARRQRMGETMERFYMGKEDFNVKPPVAELPPPPVVSTLETPRIDARNTAQMVFDIPALRGAIKSFLPKYTQDDIETIADQARESVGFAYEMVYVLGSEKGKPKKLSDVISKYINLLGGASVAIKERLDLLIEQNRLNPIIDEALDFATFNEDWVAEDDIKAKYGISIGNKKTYTGKNADRISDFSQKIINTKYVNIMKKLGVNKEEALKQLED
jgi:hypothetical protein